ncbi:hypothetical protein NIM87_17070 [Devosia sp. XJ19-1]|uniref:Uncharacterized protein n=1 Tax=Devosia ureilytica TaxID=2952754 RepID=A0A9Q4FTY6_9HYPH|nr:hypothetical protein [Devosia ureilytica]MCP8885224.1 hypothetical protein [Devosia ureilytica]MCP8888682.1 hypothetical protein [Devosia ureilytica]
MVRSVVAIGGLLLAGLATIAAMPPALAQDACGFPIRSLALAVARDRLELPPIQARRFGARALYLGLQYGTQPDDELDRLLAEAVEGRVHGAADLDFAWRVQRDGLEDAIATLGDDALKQAIDTGRPSSIRALIAAGEADAVMAAIATLPQGNQFGLGQTAVTVTFDLPDEKKAELAALAAAHDLSWLAAGFVAAQDNPEAWSDHIDGMSTEDLDELASVWSRLPAFNGNPILTRSTALQGPEDQVVREAIRMVSHAAALQPEISFLMTFLEQTGASQEAAEVAKTLIKRFENGDLAATGPLDAGWLATLELFNKVGFDADRLRPLFGPADYGLNRAGRDTAGDILDWIVAVDALTPYLNDGADLPASAPSHLSSAFTEWDRWLTLAQAVNSDPTTAVSTATDADRAILAELLLAADDYDLLVQLLESAPVTLESVRMADDLAARLDRLYSAHLWHEGEAPLLAGQALFKFD